MVRLRRTLLRIVPLLGYLLFCVFAGKYAAEPLRVILAWLPFSLGLLCGFALAVVCGTLWVFIAGPLQEQVQEWLFDPPQPSDLISGDPITGAVGLQGVLVSDLHIDTWGLHSEEPTERETRFLSLLAAVKASPTVDSFYLNGDLMDIPLHPNTDDPERLMLDLSGALSAEHGILLERYDAVLKPLLNLTEPEVVPQPKASPALPIRRSIFQTGNHDIGVSGLRYVRPQMPSFLPPVQTVWNPSLLLQSAADGTEYPHWAYIEHGHHWDPLLWLYLRYALLDILRFGHSRGEAQLFSSLQRGGKQGMGSQTLKGDNLPPAPLPGTLRNHFIGDQPGLLSWFVRLRYRQAARRTFREFQCSKDDGREYRRIRTLLVGHTHHPDRYVFPGGLVYINSGDWSGATHHCAYCVLEADGTVRGPFQWENTDKSEFKTA